MKEIKDLFAKVEKPKTIRFDIRLPDFLYNDLKSICEKHPGFTMSKLIILATIKDIQRYL